jgi:adenosine deaminase
VSRDLVALPKVHLHVHLESTVRPESVPPPPPVFTSFGAFVDWTTAVRACLRTDDDFERAAYAFCLDSAADGVRYAELTFTAAAHGVRLGTGDRPLEAVLAGLRAGTRDAGIDVRLVLDHSRRRPVEWAESTVRMATAHPDFVVGFGVAGEEAPPLAPYASVVEAAAEAGVHLVHHAGETAGPDSVREAIRIGRAERIGHGIRALEDPDVVAELRDRDVPLEVCPSSNVAVGLVPSAAEHPLPLLLDAGLAVTLSTDMPAVTGRTLSDEYAAVRAIFGATDDELATLAVAAVDASFAPASLKADLRADIAAWLTNYPHAAART